MRLVILAGAALSLCACAFGDNALELGYTDAVAKPGVLSEAAPTAIDVTDVQDAREARKPVGKAATADPKRPMLVGYKRNGFGQNTGNIVAEEPVADIVEAALETMLEANGHMVAEDAPLAMETTLRDFWFDYKTGLVSVEFVADVIADVVLRDRASGMVLFEDSFSGSASAKQAGGLSGTWERVMNDALADMIRQVSLSGELAEAIEDGAAEEPVDAPMADTDEMMDAPRTGS